MEERIRHNITYGYEIRHTSSELVVSEKAYNAVIFESKYIF